MKDIFKKAIKLIENIVFCSFAGSFIFYLVIMFLLDFIMPGRLFSPQVIFPIAALFVGTIIFLSYRITFHPKITKSITWKKHSLIKLTVFTVFVSIVVIFGLWYIDHIQREKSLADANKHFIITIHDKVAQERIDNTIVELEKQVCRLKNEYGVEKDIAIKAVLFDNITEYQEFAFVKWSGGAARVENGMPVIYLIAEQGDNFFTHKNATGVPAHELTHVILFEKLGQNIKEVPPWFNEGLAEYETWKGFTNGGTRASIRFSLWQIHDEIVNSPAVISYSTYPAEEKQIAQFYANSYELIRYLVSQHDEDTIKQVLILVGRGENFESALQAKIHISSEQFYSQWLKSFY